MKIRLIGEKIMVIPDAKETKNKFGIEIPDKEQDVTTGVIHAVGDLNTTPGLKVGDRVMYEPTMAIERIIEGKTYHFLDINEDVIGVVTE